MRTKRSVLFLFTCLVLTLSLSACGSKDPLLGTWLEPVSGISLAFDSNNSVIISMHETSYTMQYAEQDPNILVIKVSEDGTLPDLTMQYKVDNNQLIITVNGADALFQREK